MRPFIIPTPSPEGFGGGLSSHPRDLVADAISTIARLAAASRLAAPRPAESESDRYDGGWSTTTAGPAPAPADGTAPNRQNVLAVWGLFK